MTEGPMSKKQGRYGVKKHSDTWVPLREKIKSSWTFKKKQGPEPHRWRNSNPSGRADNKGTTDEKKREGVKGR